MYKCVYVCALSLSLSAQDGGILTNNPCGVAIHEARVLWGSNVPIQTVVSLGTGLPRGGEEGMACSSTSLKEKVFKVVGGATDTESKCCGV